MSETPVTLTYRIAFLNGRTLALYNTLGEAREASKACFLRTRVEHYENGQWVEAPHD
jgi:hypothetical protein